MYDRAFPNAVRQWPNAVCGRTGAGINQWMAGKNTRKTIRKAAKPKRFPFHPAERSARELKGILARYS